MKTTLTIAIPTYNRGPVVIECLESLRSQTAYGQFDVIVVDNDSEDATVSLLEARFGDFQRLTVVRETLRGSSAARNAALRLCTTDFIHFFDDECVVEQDFVERLDSHLAECSPLMFGGPVFPRLKGDAPLWFFEELGCAAVGQYSGRSARIYLSGANFGFRTAELREAGGFLNELGIRGSSMGFGEETQLDLYFERNFGLSAMAYFDDLPAFHLVVPEKYRLGVLLRSHFLRGRFRVRVSSLASGGGASNEIPVSFRPKQAPSPHLRLRHRLLRLALRQLRFLGTVWEKWVHGRRPYCSSR